MSKTKFMASRGTSPRDSSIVRKLTVSFMSMAGVSIFIVCVCFFVYNLIQYRDTLAVQIEAVGSVISANSAASLAFRDSRNANKILQALEAQPQVREACIFTREGELFAAFKATLAQGAAEKNCGRSPRAGPGWVFDGNVLRVYQDIHLDGELLGSLVIVRQLNDIREHAWNQAGIAAAIMVVASLVSLLMTGPLQRVLTTPILHLAEVANRVTTEQEYSLRATKQSDDEMGRLTDAFNEMLGQIEERDRSLESYSVDLERKIEERTIEVRETNDSLHATVLQLEREIDERERAEKEREDLNGQLVDASRRAGMAEIATGVLHNVGNVLNSLNVSLWLLNDEVRGSKVPRLADVVEVAEKHEDDLARFIGDDRQGKQIFPYLRKLSVTLANEQTAFLQMTSELTKNVDHIKQLVVSQQSYARSGGLVDHVAPVEIINDALATATLSMQDHGITVRRDFGDLPSVSIDRHKTLQILINLIRNAMHALDEVEQSEKLITVRARVIDESTLRVEVVDNGPGIAQEHLTRVFAHGFTTKKSGHGFGLHISATAAIEMGGTLTAHSEGLGTGATFALVIPTRPRGATAPRA